MCEQGLTDGWGSYYTTGRTCHLLPVACLLLPLVSFMAVITGRLHGQTALPKIPISHIKHMHTDTHTYQRHFNLPQEADVPQGQVGHDAGSEGSHQGKLHLSGLLWDLACP